MTDNFAVFKIFGKCKPIAQLHANRLVIEPRLLVGDAQFTVNSGEDALHLTQSEHASKKCVAGIVSVARLVHNAALLVGEGHSVINTHRKLWILFFKDAAQFYKVGTTAQMTCLGEVAIREDVA